MNSEMNILNLMNNCGGSFKASPGPKAKSTIDSQTMKTDGAPAKEGVVRIGANNNTAPRTVFKKVLNDVASANKKAVAANEGGANMRSSKTKQPEQKDPNDRQALIGENLTHAMTPAGAETKDSSETQSIPLTDEYIAAAALSDASILFQKAIIKVSQTLNLKIDQGSGPIQLENATPTVKELCAEILSAIKEIMGILENAASSNQSVAVNGKQVDASEAISMGRTLRTEIFHIEMALSMSGNGADVAALVARNGDQQSDNGLAQAKDPGKISMPTSDIKQMLDGDLFSDGNKVESMFLKLVQMLRDQAGSGASGPEAGVPDVQTAALETSETAVAPSSDGKKASQVGDYDSLVMRTLLKIDKTKIGNKEAALQNDQMDLPKVTEALFAKKPAEVAEARSEKIDAVIQGIFTGKDQSTASGFVDRLKSTALPKTMEESVMTQLSSKVQAAVKTGVTEIRLLLRPESLGEMRVKLTMDGDVVMGKIYVENQQVKHIVETNMQSLKDSLAQHNLQTGSFDVNVGGGAREQLDDFPRNIVARSENGAGGLSGAAENTEDPADNLLGNETGRRFGSNTIEYFA